MELRQLGQRLRQDDIDDVLGGEPVRMTQPEEVAEERFHIACSFGGRPQAVERRGRLERWTQRKEDVVHSRRCPSQLGEQLLECIFRPGGGVTIAGAGELLLADENLSLDLAQLLRGLDRVGQVGRLQKTFVLHLQRGQFEKLRLQQTHGTEGYAHEVLPGRFELRHLHAWPLSLQPRDCRLEVALIFSELRRVRLLRNRVAPVVEDGAAPSQLPANPAAVHAERDRRFVRVALGLRMSDAFFEPIASQ